MAFRDFSFPEVQQTLGLNLAEAGLYGSVPSVELRAGFAERIAEDTELALAIDTEKARSEFIIAPVLAELRRMNRGVFSLFSGVEFDVDSSRGLNGFCDFILARSPLQLVLTAPVVAIVEAKNDNIKTGLGQCIAAMVAAREFNAKTSTGITVVHGVVTTGSAWKFLRLVGSDLTIDRHEYSIIELARIVGILTHIIRDV